MKKNNWMFGGSREGSTQGDLANEKKSTIFLVALLVHFPSVFGFFFFASFLGFPILRIISY